MIPPYVVLTRAQGRFSEEGFLGPKYKPFATGGDPNAAALRGRRHRRPRHYRRAAEGPPRVAGQDEHHGRGRWPASPQMAAAEDAKKAAYELILGPARRSSTSPRRSRNCGPVTAATPSGRSAWWRGGWSKAGVPYVVINYPGGWDTHSNHFATMRRQCPQLDQGLAALLADLKDRGLLESTLVWCCGEFGRTPEDRLAAALERRPQPLRQRLQRAGGRRRIQGRATSSGRRTRRPKRSRSGPSIRSTCWAASITWPASTPTPGCRIPWASKPTCCPTRRNP